ncbi:MAG: hypothetical protein GF331_08790 [Chitinivibrionales bacterium]|nr:hypothetical protein [Chitinivibrionales bacterium]
MSTRWLRNLVLVIVSAAVATQASPMVVAAGLDGVTDWSDAEPFVDLFKMSRTWHWLDADDSRDWPHNTEPKPVNGIPVDNQGWPLRVPFQLNGAARRVCTTMLNGREKEAFEFGTYTLLFEGEGEIRLSNLYSATITHDGVGVKQYQFEITQQHFGSNDVSPALRLNIYRSVEGNHIRNIRMIRPGCLDIYETQPFTERFLRDVRPFAILRFMDWNNTNGNTQSTWSQRRPKDYATQTMMPDPPNNLNGVAYEWMIELCNTVERDMWVTVPHKADANYQRQLARLIRDNLDPSLKCYVEWSNETWNWNFPQTSYAEQQGYNTLKLDDKVGAAVNKYHTYAAVRLFKIFEEEFSAQRDRLVTVLAGRHNPVTGDSERIIKALDDPVVNPDNIVPDAFATAPYMNTPTRVSSVNAAFDGLRQGLARAAEGTRKWKPHCDSYGLRFITYEGGQHLNKASEEIIIATNEHADMYDLYVDYLDSLEAYGLTMLNAFVAVAGWNSYGAWGHKQYAGEPLSSAHKYRALIEYMTASGQYDPNENWQPYGGVISIDSREQAVPAATGGEYVIYRNAGMSNPLTVLSSQRAAARVLTINGRTVGIVAPSAGAGLPCPAAGSYVISRDLTRGGSALVLTP